METERNGIVAGCLTMHGKSPICHAERGLIGDLPLFRQPRSQVNSGEHQSKPKTCPFPHLALHADLTALGFDEILCDGQAEAAAGVGCGTADSAMCA